jgi:hypothetical protein
MMNSDVPNGSESRNTSLDMGGIGTIGAFHQSGESSGAGNDATFDIASEIKRWQQMHQANLSSSSTTALLSSSGTSSNLPHDASTAALIQQVLESQQRGSNSNRFDIPLATSMGLAGSTFGSIVGSGDSNFGSELFSNNDNNNNGGLNQLQSNFFSDARLLMAQQAVAAMNFPSYPGVLLQQQQPQQQNENNSSLELPLPSPHSLFHRDGTRRMRGGVIEPFPVRRLLLFHWVMPSAHSFLHFGSRKNCIASCWKLKVPVERISFPLYRMAVPFKSTSLISSSRT